MKTYNNFRMTFEAMDESTRAMATFLLTAVGAWFLLAFLGGMLNLFNQPVGPPFAVGLFLLVPIIGFASTYLLSTRVRHAIDSLPLRVVTIALMPALAKPWKRPSRSGEGLLPLSWSAHSFAGALCAPSFGSACPRAFAGGRTATATAMRTAAP